MKFLGEQRQLRVDSGSPPDELSVIDKITDPAILTSHVVNTETRTQVKRYRHMRLSEIDGACAREWVIGNLYDEKRFERIAFPRTCMMDMGSAVHYWVRNSGYFGDRLLGYWRCLACGSRRRFGVVPKEPCEFCNARPGATIYDEYYFRINAPYMVTGKTDLILQMDGIYRFGEIKSTAQNVMSPQGKDVAQLASYMFFSKYDTSASKLPIEIDQSCGYLLYFNKLFTFDAPIRTFAVRPTDRLMRPLIEKASLFTEGVTTGKLPPPLRVCSRNGFVGGRAKLCGVAKVCKIYVETNRPEIKV